MNDLVSRNWLIECVEEGWIKFDTQEDENKFIHLVRDIAQPAELKWHDCDPTDKNTLPEPGSWAIWCDKEDHKIIARWKEDAIDHFWPDQRMFDFDLEDAVAWTEIPKRTKSPSTESETCAYWDRESNICALHRPSAQPEIIHCKYCKYREHDERYGYMCSLDTGDPYELGRCAEDENWYCADAKRRQYGND